MEGAFSQVELENACAGNGEESIRGLLLRDLIPLDGRCFALVELLLTGAAEAERCSVIGYVAPRRLLFAPAPVAASWQAEGVEIIIVHPSRSKISASQKLEIMQKIHTPCNYLQIVVSYSNLGFGTEFQIPT